MTKTSLQPAWYLSVAGIAASLGIKAATLSHAIWRTPGHPCHRATPSWSLAPARGTKAGMIIRRHLRISDNHHEELVRSDQCNRWPRSHSGTNQAKRP
jgi:hypothetical protein